MGAGHLVHATVVLAEETGLVRAITDRQYMERRIIAWLAILLGAYFLSRASAGKREKHAMKELLGMPLDKVKFFRNVFIHRLESLFGFLFVGFGVAIHLYVLVRQAQKDEVALPNNPQEAIGSIVTYVLFAILAMVVITALMHLVCSYFSRRIFLDLLSYLMARYGYRVQDDPALLKQIGDMLGVERSEDDTVESYTRRIETGLKLEEIRARLKARGKPTS
jgi:hypothetical protein